LQAALSVVARVLISPIFLMSGMMKIMHWSETAQHMTDHGMRAVPFFLAAAIVVELAGGLSVLLGIKPRWGAGLLVLFLIPVTLVFHSFWQYDGRERENQMQHFSKNVTIIGGLLALSACGAVRRRNEE